MVMIAVGLLWALWQMSDPAIFNSTHFSSKNRQRKYRSQHARALEYDRRDCCYCLLSLFIMWTTEEKDPTNELLTKNIIVFVRL